MTSRLVSPHSDPVAAASPALTRKVRPRRNWPLWVGLGLVTVFVLAALVGPWLAPHDPMARTPVVNVDGRWVGPPFPPLSPGFLLGSDRAGRDLFSRLLWGIRPTLALVAIIAAVRLVLGMVLGIAAGYGGGWGRRVAGLLIRAALVVPVLVVALATIAFVGIQRGLWAFLLGLCLTGWAETARYVEVQTRLIKQQPFMESANAMGAPAGHQLLYHVVRHVLPLSAMLVTQEVSSTLMTIAMLGFLGYYIGGGAWLTVEDWVARSTAGMPELGQMLATSTERLFDVGLMLVVGGVVVLLIFGFSLLGEGLRRQLQGEAAGRLTWLNGSLTTVTGWVDGGVLTTPRARRGALLAGGVAAAVLAALVGVNWWLGQANAVQPAAGFSLVPPGGQQWATGRHDPFGTLTISGTGPISPTVLWSFQHEGGLTAGPALSADGTVYVGGSDNVVLAIDPQGQEVRRWTLPAAPVGAPAVGPDGTVYVVDAGIGNEGPGLSALAANGTTKWRTASAGRRPTSGPVVGPDGTIYFSRVDYIQAVTPDGQAKWLAGPMDQTIEMAPRLSPDGTAVYLSNGIFATADGRPVPGLAIRDELKFQIPYYATGADGGTYLLAGNTAIRWQVENGEPTAANAITWDIGGLNIYLPSDSGIAPDGSFWLFYGNTYANTRMVWLDAAGKTLADIQVPIVGSKLLGIDSDQRAYVCAAVAQTICGALDLATKSQAWQLRLDNGLKALGGAVAPGRLYVTTSDGWVHALGDAAAPQS